MREGLQSDPNTYALDLESPYHEAGHVIVAYRLGVGIEYVSIVPDGEHAGEVSYVELDDAEESELMAGEIEPGFKVSPAALSVFKSKIMCSMGGRIAEEIVNGTYDPDRVAEDNEHIQDALKKVGLTKETGAEFLAELEKEVRAILVEMKSNGALEVIATDLMKKGKMTGEEVYNRLRELNA